MKIFECYIAPDSKRKHIMFFTKANNRDEIRDAFKGSLDVIKFLYWQGLVNGKTRKLINTEETRNLYPYLIDLQSIEPPHLLIDEFKGFADLNSTPSIEDYVKLKNKKINLTFSEVFSDFEV